MILQTHVAVPDRPSNRGVFPGGPEVQEILIGSRGPRPGGTGQTRKEDFRRVLVDPKIGCRVPRDGL